ncbi:MAG: TolC family protein [Sedimentisphaerales bacterium]|nr:TolC family protein [Sedimentisphaerales bacterium]
MRSFGKGITTPYGWISLAIGTMLLLAAGPPGSARGAAVDAQAPDNVGGYILDWDRLSRIDGPLLQDEPRQTVSLSLEHCIRRALAHNLDIRIGQSDPAIRMADLAQAEAAFDAVLFSSFDTSLTDEGNPDSGYFTRTVQTNNGSRNIRVPTDPFTQYSDTNYALGLRKRLPAGGSIELAQRARRLRFEEEGLYRNPFYESSLDLELRQPLLRDFGIDINRARIQASWNSFAISQQQFNLLVIKTVAEVEGNFWRLVYLRQQVRILEELVRQARATLQRLEARTTLDAGAGVIARSRGLIGRSQADLVSARNDVLQQQDRLLESINDPNLPLSSLWEIIPLATPTEQHYAPDRQKAIKVALQMRPELIAQGLTLDTAQIAVGVARNQLLPRLDLVARQEVTGPGSSYRDSWQQQGDLDTINYLMGLSFEVPLGNRSAEAELVKTQHEKRQEKLRLESYKEQVLLDVSISLHELYNSFREIAVRREAMTAEADELLAYLVQEQTDAKIDANFLNRKLDSHERLSRTQILLAQTLFRYNVALVDFHRAEGTLLQYNNITLAEERQRPDDPAP